MFYGIDIQTRNELIASNYSVDEICRIIGADSLEYLSEEGLVDSIGRPYPNEPYGDFVWLISTAITQPLYMIMKRNI